jgi:phage/plasmid-like protein (TIGR03299 family)
MAHNLNYNKNLNRHAMVSLCEKPWHGLGKVVNEAMTSHDAIALAGLDYEVKLGKLYSTIYDELPRITLPSDIINIPNYFATYRKDTNDYFGVVGSRYEIVQNREAFSFFDEIVGKKEAMFETAGALGKGETIFITAKLPHYIKIGGSDIIEKYLLFTSTHDGSGSIKAMLTPIRVVCNNTLNQALKNNTNKITLKHTLNVHDRLKEGARLMGLVNVHSENFQHCLNYLSTCEITVEQINKLVTELYLSYTELELLNRANGRIEIVDEISTKKKNTINDVLVSIDNGIGQNVFRGSAYWLYNGITTYYSNKKSYSSDEDRFTSILEGSSSSIQQKAFDKILTLTN